MDSLTTFERALLAEFESLASTCATSGKASADTAAQLSRASEHFSEQIAKLRQRQTAQETLLNALAEALQGQIEQTGTLIEQVNALLRERGS